MKKLLPFILLLAVLPACQKLIDKKIEAALMDAITSGTWYVETFRENTNDLTSSFSSYEFKFYKNGVVEGLEAGQVTISGSWNGDLDNRSINASFPSAADPLKKVNGLWKITDSYMDFVEAEMRTQAGKNILHLRKK